MDSPGEQPGESLVFALILWYKYDKKVNEVTAMDVTLEQMLLARENRVRMQEKLLAQYHIPLISFTMNIPGPVKDTPLIRRGFREGVRQVLGTLAAWGLKPRHLEQVEAVTGWEGYFSVDAPARRLKQLCADIEIRSDLGRLFDLDVLDVDGSQLRRGLFGEPERGCMVCGAPGRGCASRRIHSVEQLQKAAGDILTAHFREQDSQAIGRCALRGILDEVCTSPKPGLVDRFHNGSHRDMDLFTFTASASALAPYFISCAAMGQQTRDLPPEETFRRLRRAGVAAEQTMLEATSGVNTHKGAVFTIGILCGAMGRLWTAEGSCREERAIFAQCAAMTGDIMRSELEENRPIRTAGERLYQAHRLPGIRGEAAAGFPSVANIGLPVLRRCLGQGLSRNDSAVVTLLHLIAQVADTNMVARGGLERAGEAARRVSRLLEESPVPTRAQLEELDAYFVAHRLSPGGCADLLAATLFLHDWCDQ